MKKKILIEGMTCEYCASQVIKSLLEVLGVNSVDVNMAEKSALVELNHEVSDQKLIIAVAEAKCKVVEIKNII
ncbi:cation transporter [Alkaliphilus peptidifermentans]|uniref:Copper chaperone CopZ n=1 Tax=Alkaliphilus peptidifermentans DSM 18978 TaxID=1120976 RepID=A0A1G5C1A5_9FIRM|nr:cation transporter [Alkaliphilus peptidifermentans]SCX96074.1 Copper chaperone CopZ [Alkaliphilus peptidifermentans DSM 18978]